MVKPYNFFQQPNKYCYVRNDFQSNTNLSISTEKKPYISSKPLATGDALIKKNSLITSDSKKFHNYQYRRNFQMNESLKNKRKSWIRPKNKNEQNVDCGNDDYANCSNLAHTQNCETKSSHHDKLNQFTSKNTAIQEYEKKCTTKFSQKSEYAQSKASPHDSLDIVLHSNEKVINISNEGHHRTWKRKSTTDQHSEIGSLGDNSESQSSDKSKIPQISSKNLAQLPNRKGKLSYYNQQYKYNARSSNKRQRSSSKNPNIKRINLVKQNKNFLSNICIECKDTKDGANHQLVNDADERKIEQPNFDCSMKSPIDNDRASQIKDVSVIEELNPKLSLFAYVGITSKIKNKSSVSNNKSIYFNKNINKTMNKTSNYSKHIPNEPRTMKLIRIQQSESTPLCPRGANCTLATCTKRHDVPMEASKPTCQFFEKDGMCWRGNECPFRHVKVSEDAEVCARFQKFGYCEKKDCYLRHIWRKKREKT